MLEYSHRRRVSRSSLGDVTFHTYNDLGALEHRDFEITILAIDWVKYRDNPTIILAAYLNLISFPSCSKTVREMAIQAIAVCSLGASLSPATSCPVILRDTALVFRKRTSFVIE